MHVQCYNYEVDVFCATESSHSAIEFWFLKINRVEDSIILKFTILLSAASLSEFKQK
jgi:hypothetical protein